MTAAESPAGGPNRAAASPEVDLGQLASTVKSIRSELTSLGEAVQGVARHVADLDAGLAAVREFHGAQLVDVEMGISAITEAHGAQLADLERWLKSTITAVSSLSDGAVMPSPELQAKAPPIRLLSEGERFGPAVQVWTVMSFLAAAGVSNEQTLVSVVMPTRNRARLAERAIHSVLSQRHRNLELLVVEDGSTDGTADVLAEMRDPRVRVLRATGVGATAARNMALDQVRGGVVAYLDDDNLMHPGWLEAIAWAFERWPDAQTLYGARLMEDAGASAGRSSGLMPSLDWAGFDRAKLERGNYIDMNVFSHRAGLVGMRFDEKLRSNGDWQFILNLTSQYQPLELPVVACVYGAYASNRISDGPHMLQDNRTVRARAHASRRLRVLVHPAGSLPAGAHSLPEAVALLEDGTAGVAFSGAEEPPAGLPEGVPSWQDLGEGVREMQPDVILLVVDGQGGDPPVTVDRTAQPFALRLVGAAGESDVTSLREHPFCLGVWTDATAGPTAGELSAALEAWRLEHA